MTKRKIFIKLYNNNAWKLVPGPFVIIKNWAQPTLKNDIFEQVDNISLAVLGLGQIGIKLGTKHVTHYKLANFT